MAPYFKPVVDLIATHPPPNGSLDLVLQLCQAVEAEHGEKIVLLTRRVVADVNPRMSPPVLIPEEVWYETMARMMFMGEHADLQLLLDWYERPISFASTRKEAITQHWEGMFAFITLPPAKLPEKELDRQFTRIITALKFVLPAHASAVAEEGPVLVPHPSTGELPPGSFGTATFGRPSRSVVLGAGISKLVWSWMTIHQQFLDDAWRQLGSRTKVRGDKLLALRDRWRAALSQTFANPRFNKLARLAQIKIELAKIKYGRSPNHDYLDAFLPHESRQFGFTPYDREPQDEPPGKTAWLVDLFRYRGSQLHFMLDEYGEHYPPDASPRTPAAIHEEKHRKATYAARRKLIDQVEKRATSLRLESEDDLVSFGCAFHKALMGASAAQPLPADRVNAWNTLLDFLDLHLKTQTTRTEFNLDEEPSYFDRLFPRAINGGALMDCGVYAVRLAFVSLSLADCLRSAAYPNPPRVSFIMFPLHVGLIVEIDGFPSLVIHNEILFRLTDEQTKKAREEWDKSPEPSDPTDPALLDQKFLEDVAAQMFLRDVDTPLLRLPIAPVSAPPKKPEIWKAFRTLVVKKIGRLFSPRIEDPNRPEFQFDLRFLSVLTLEKRWHDKTVVPFWNEDCFGLWNRSKNSLQQNPAKREEYAKALEGLLKPVEESYGVLDPNRPPQGEVLPKKIELTEELRANPDLLGPTAQRITVSSRLKNFANSLGPVGQVREHLDAVRKATGAVPEPPFATEADLLSRYGD